MIDTVQTASKAATVSGRGKVKADDFKFAIRHDEVATGRVKELLTMEKSLKDARKQFDTGEGKVGLERGPRGRKRKVDAAAAVGGRLAVVVMRGRSSGRSMMGLGARRMSLMKMFEDHENDFAQTRLLEDHWPCQKKD